MGERQIKQSSLEQDLKEALDIFMQVGKDVNVEDLDLRPWQKDLMELLNKLSNREIIWIKGKSWMQRYIQSYYGTHRVLMLTAKSRTSNIAQVLRKRQLATTDKFLFNDDIFLQNKH